MISLSVQPGLKMADPEGGSSLIMASTYPQLGVA